MSIYKYGLAVFIALLACQSMAYKLEKDIEYDYVDGTSLKLDVYRPSATGSALRPAVVYTHGGCFSSGSKADIPNELKALADDGVVIFSVDYRVYPHRYPKGMIDVQQAVRFIRKNASRFQVDKTKIGTHGESAGGYLASVLGVRPMPDRNGVIDQYSGRVQFVSDWYGRVDFTRAQGAVGSDCAASFLGLPRTGANAPAFLEASIHPYVDKNSARFHILQGTHDEQVVPAHSVLLANTLWNVGVPAMLTLAEYSGHGLGLTNIPWKITRSFFLKSFGLTNSTPVSQGNTFKALAINSGQTDSENYLKYSKDQMVSGGGVYDYGVIPTAGTNYSPLYYDVHIGKDFTYSAPTQFGLYKIGLFFAEKQSNISKSGVRLFNVNLRIPVSNTTPDSLKDLTILPNLDIYALAGRDRALIRNSIQMISLSKNIRVNFKSVRDNAVLSFFELTPIAY